MDKLMPQQRSENMRRIRSKDMEPELEVRRLVHRLGYRFRLHDTNLPANPTSFSVPAEKLSKFTVAFGISIIPTSCEITRKPKSKYSLLDTQTRPEHGPRHLNH